MEHTEVQQPEQAEKLWYIVKVQNNRESGIRDAIIRKIAIAGMDDMFGGVVIPTERVTEIKNGKKRIIKRKLYPGYVVVNMVLNDDTWFLIREIRGVADFTGPRGKPLPLSKAEAARLTAPEIVEDEESPKLNIQFAVEDTIKITSGSLEGLEGVVTKIDVATGLVTVLVTIFGRSTPVDISYWQVQPI